jgi:hypothetical protein
MTYGLTTKIIKTGTEHNYIVNIDGAVPGLRMKMPQIYEPFQDETSL